MSQDPQSTKYLYIYGGAIGDALLGMQVRRVLKARQPNAQIILVSTRRNRFVEQLFKHYGVEYREWPKEDWRSWVGAFSLLNSSWKVGLFEPVTVELPLWWRLLLWLASRRTGGKEVRYQMKLHERPVPRRAEVFVYDCSQANLFDLAGRLVDAWGIKGVDPKPELVLPPSARPFHEPYILFHFFAGQVRRSVPVAHAKEILKAAREAYPRHRFVLTCAQGEMNRAYKATEGVDEVEIKADLPAMELLSFLSHADLVVGTASGIIHLSAHIHAPTVALCNLSDPCWLPSYNPEVTLLAEKSNCGCGGNRDGVCEIKTNEGPFFRCLYDIPTSVILAAMAKKLPHKHE